MQKNFFFHFLLSASFLFLFSCSSDPEPESKYYQKLASFDIYEKELEELMEEVAEHYELDLDFDVDTTERKYSLSVLNASVNDILKKLSTDTGYFMKVVDEEILVEDEPIDESMEEVTFRLNGNLWKDIRSASKKIDIDEETVQKFFGPLFTNVEVTDVNAYSKTIDLYLPKEEIPFIKNSLLYLNYLKHRRNLAITVWVVEKDKAQSFLDNNSKSEDAEFAWKLNAGDNIIFTQKGNKIDLSSQLLSASDNIAEAEVFVKMKFNEDSVEHNFNFAKKKIQSVNLSDKLTLIVKSDWYAAGFKVASQNLNSINLAKYRKKLNDRIYDQLKVDKTLKAGKASIGEIMSNYHNYDFATRVVSFTSGKKSDISNYAVNSKASSYSLQAALENISENSSARYFVDNYGVLIDCQGTIRGYRNVVWKIQESQLDESFYRFFSGAFLVDKEGLNKPVIYLPSANALVGFSNSNILK